MKRPFLITAVVVLQTLLGVLLAGLAVYLLTLTRSPEMVADPDASGAAHGLLLGAAVLGVPALITLFAVWELWKGHFWGWLLSLATDVGVLAVFVYNMVHDNYGDRSDILLAAGFAVGIVLLLLPAVRAFFWGAATKETLSS